jgi:hypothetical protein
MRTKLITLIAAFVFSWNAFAQDETCQNLYFNEGWNLFSTYIELYNEDAPIFFQTLIDANTYIFAKNNIAEFYIPEWGMGWLLINNNQGYYLKVSTADTIIHCGTQIIPEEYPITLEQGWNIMPYLRDTPQDAEEALSSISSEIHLVKNILGQVYMPSWEYNGIGDLEPGKGYQIKMNSEQTLIYDANDE